MDFNTILGPEGLIAKHLAHYEYRPQQVEAAQGMWDALCSKKHCIVEAGTGVGKSMAYLLPAAEYTAGGGKKVVISTYTLYLQSQLMSKDIPFIQEIMPERKLKAVLMKGRGNYLCLNNFDAELSQLYLIGDPNLGRIRKWAEETETGDVSELDFPFGGWSDICSNQDTCRRQDCRYVSKCFYYKMRKASADADIIVTNHSLFLTDLAIRGVDPNSGIIPHYDAVIFDEAHHLEEVATKVFGVECDAYDIPDFLNRIKRSRGVAVDSKRLDSLEDLNNQIFSAFMRSPKQEFFFSDLHSRSAMEQIQSLASSLCTLLDGLLVEFAHQETDGRPELLDRVEGLKKMCN
ncbi:MAG TPA: DEAD/DEAH box helicase, partial [Armatimonadota bacterium]